MNKDVIQGRWMEVRGKVRERWGKLTDDDLDLINGRREQLAGLLQQRYGFARKEAEKQLKLFEHELEKMEKEQPVGTF